MKVKLVSVLTDLNKFDHQSPNIVTLATVSKWLLPASIVSQVERLIGSGDVYARKDSTKIHILSVLHVILLLVWPVLLRNNA